MEDYITILKKLNSNEDINYYIQNLCAKMMTIYIDNNTLPIAQNMCDELINLVKQDWHHTKEAVDIIYNTIISLRIKIIDIMELNHYNKKDIKNMEYLLKYDRLEQEKYYIEFFIKEVNYDYIPNNLNKRYKRICNEEEYLIKKYINKKS